MNICWKCGIETNNSYDVVGYGTLCCICEEDYEEETWCDECDNWLCDCECGEGHE